VPANGAILLSRQTVAYLTYSRLTLPVRAWTRWSQPSVRQL